MFFLKWVVFWRKSGVETKKAVEKPQQSMCMMLLYMTTEKCQNKTTELSDSPQTLIPGVKMHRIKINQSVLYLIGEDLMVFNIMSVAAFCLLYLKFHFFFLPKHPKTIEII